jgi:threonine synthase
MGYELPGDRSHEPTEQTIAEGIAIKTLYRLDKIMELINSYGVSIVYVNNNDVKIGLKELLKLGIFAEPTGAAAYAGFRKAVETGEDLSYSKVLIPVTGSGFKTLDKIYRILAT